MKNWGKELVGLVLYLALVFGIAFLLSRVMFQKVQVDGVSMEPTLEDKQQLLVNKMSYHIHKIERFDIVAFKYQYEDNTYYIKRIIGLPGETVSISEDGVIRINGKMLKEDYGAEIMTDPGLAQNGVKLGEDEYFVLGDNRNNSKDSRNPEVAAVSKDSIIGKAWMCIWPVQSFGMIH